MDLPLTWDKTAETVSAEGFEDCSPFSVKPSQKPLCQLTDLRLFWMNTKFKNLVDSSFFSKNIILEATVLFALFHVSCTNFLQPRFWKHTQGYQLLAWASWRVKTDRKDRLAVSLLLAYKFAFSVSAGQHTLTRSTLQALFAFGNCMKKLLKLPSEE